MRKRILMIVLALGPILGLAVSAMADSPASVRIRTALPVQQKLDHTIACYGTVAFDDSRVVHLVLPRDGRIEAVLARVGEAVDKNRPLVRFTTAPADRQAYEQAVSSEALARQDLRRVKEMVAASLATQSQLAVARKALAQAEAALKTQRLLGTGDAEGTLHTPIDGVVTAVNVRSGDRVPAGTAVIQISPTANLVALLGVEPEDSYAVRPGLRVTVRSVFDPSQRVRTTVRTVERAIDPKTRLVTVLAELPATMAKPFLPAMAVQGEIVLNTSLSWVVPRSAVLRDADGAYIFQISNGKAHRIRVTTGIETDRVVAIEGDFDPKREVVVQGNYELEDGMAVREAHS